MTPNPNLIPPHVRETIDEWVRCGRPTGDFVRAVLENDLTEAIGRADYLNLEALPHIVAYLYNYVDLRAWGSKAKVARWEEEMHRRRVEVSK